jgi:hypothetical protein
VGGEGLPAVDPPRLRTSVDTGAQFNISDDVVDAMGMTRSQFVDQLAAGIFPEEDVDLLIPTMSLVEPHRADSGMELDERGREYGRDRLVAVQVKRFYQIPRFRVASADIDLMDQIFITDGEIWVELNFRSSTWNRER